MSTGTTWAATVCACAIARRHAAACGSIQIKTINGYADHAHPSRHTRWRQWRPRAGPGIGRIEPGDDRQRGPSLVDRLRERRDAVQRPAGRKHTGRRHQALRRFHADQPVERRRYATGAGRVRTQCDVGGTGRDRDRASGTAATADVRRAGRRCGTRRTGCGCPRDRSRTDPCSSCRPGSRPTRSAGTPPSPCASAGSSSAGQPAVDGTPARSMLSLMASRAPANTPPGLRRPVRGDLLRREMGDPHRLVHVVTPASCQRSRSATYAADREAVNSDASGETASGTMSR